MTDAPAKGRPETGASPPAGLPGHRGRRSGIAEALGILLPIRRPEHCGGSAGTAHWLVPGGLVIGLVYVGLYRASWRVFGEVGGVRLMPALAVWLADVGLFGLTAILAAARIADRWPSADPTPADTRERSITLAAALALGTVLVAKLILWTAVPEGIAGWPADWKRYFNFVYPWPVYRPLILAPMWGRWALILAAGIGRTALAQPLPAGLRQTRPMTNALGWFAVVTALTAIYCGRHGQWVIGCIISLLVLGATFLFTVVTTRHFRGQTRFGVQAAALVAEAAFLLCYLAFSQHIYRY